ncbi:hypothetical protein [Pseudobacteriovorax antillogorgiicola]|uniref:Ribonuclease Z n=1 Tax=Pseudobacteriovorax antillogorgiicola TaxID=1513793 RepID=A0A1Y6CSE8_9BACT|nr:hypothetical protein [Pseudobacteriovorax antillogorgiicola]TCS46173.1 ribonuclease Z [Pseudobacteriovorax antillogorgiicola]SMF69984.1 ribonuclease Z [Pseudobacteriovorax antillogorgiicola]
MSERIKLKSFDIEFLNGYMGDPATLVSIKRSGIHILFDLGSLENASHKDLLKVRQVFVSHTHVDHFIGFDRLLRINIPHRKPLHLWGPQGFASNVQGKILGYTWNLIDSDQLPFWVSEIQETKINKAFFLGKVNDFRLKPEDLDQMSDSVALLSDGSSVKAVALDHKGTDSIAYRLETPLFNKINGEALKDLNLDPGPWIQKFLDRLAIQDLEGAMEVGGKQWAMETLAQRIVLGSDQCSLAYLTDFSFDQPNLDRLLKCFGDARAVICEASFLDEDRGRSVAKAHLTTRQAALVASLLGCEEFLAFHVSNIYAGRGAEALEEASAFFEAFKRMTRQELDNELLAEHKRVAQCKSDLGMV